MAKHPVIKKILKRKQPSRKRAGKGVNRTNADRVLAQGTGRAVERAFGCKVPRSVSLHPKVWDAFATAHAPLPRSVGPYTVVRTSFLTLTNSRCGIIGTFKTRQRNPGNAGGKSPLPGGWTNCVMATEEGVGAINSTTSTGFHFAPFPGGSAQRGESSFTCCPAAISVQIMGPEAIGVASGQLLAAVAPVRLDLSADPRTWEQVQADLTAYFRPRLLSAGKISLRGVQMDSHPLSMNDVSSFEPLLHVAPNPNTTTPEAWQEEQPYPCGWAPMYFVNPTQTPLQLLISVEWRVRFDLGNPAVSTHEHHGVSSDMAWDQHIRRAADALPGVVDIVEKVANTGLGLYSKAASAGLI